jgi:putative peptidoglycan lipid II flippase
VDELPPAPFEHGHTLRPRQVRAGVGRRVDAICARILPELAGPHTDGRLTSAEEIARALRLVGEDPRDSGGPKTAALAPTRESPDLLRADPVLEPAGPAPGLTVTRRPKAHQPAPPTRIERAQALAADASRDDRRFVIAGVLGALSLLLIIGGLAVQGAGVNVPIPFTGGEVRTLPLEAVDDFDPQGDESENPDDANLAIDGDPDTGWRTTSYFNRPELGGLKDGVGLVVDLGETREVSQVRLTLAGDATTVELYSAPDRTSPPVRMSGLVKLGSVTADGGQVRLDVDDAETRFLVVWLTSLPEVTGGKFQGDVREIVVRGKA